MNAIIFHIDKKIKKSRFIKKKKNSGTFDSSIMKEARKNIIIKKMKSVVIYEEF